MATRGEHYLRAEELADEAVMWPLLGTERYALASLASVHAMLAIAGPGASAHARDIAAGLQEAPSWACPHCSTVLHDSEAAGSHKRRHEEAGDAGEEGR